MEILSKLPKTTTKSKKRRGRGYGSGVGGHTTGRGAKGDKVRGTIKITFDGTKIKKNWIKRTPFLRGKHRTLSQHKYNILNLSDIDRIFQEGDVVDPKLLSKKLKIKEKKLVNNIKILAKGKLSKKINFKGIHFSQSAKNQIIAIGGSVD